MYSKLGKIIIILCSLIFFPGFYLKGAGVVSGGGSGTIVGTISFFNNNATTVTGPIPVQSGIYFPPGAVPSSPATTIVPYVGGVPLTQWECTSEA